MTKNRLPNQSSFRSHRQALIAAAAKRGRQAHNIWSVFSTKIRKDCILLSDVEYLNFVWMEGDPTVITFAIETDLYLADADESHGATYPDAIVELTDGHHQWREAKAKEDTKYSDERDLRQKRIQERITQELNCVYLRVTPELLKTHWQFLGSPRFQCNK